ncbi:hypothetical protein ACTXT7_017075, partial [Hymenolepis weldensis]
NVINQIQTLDITNSLPARYDLQNVKDRLEKALENLAISLKGNQCMVDNIRRDLKRLDDGLTLTKSFNEFLKIFDQTLNASDKKNLVLEVENDYKTFREKFIGFFINHGGKEFTKLTQLLLPCLQMHEAYISGIGVVCGNTGGVHRLIGYFYILALNVLFMVFLYFALFNFSSFQFIIVQMGSYDEQDETFESSSSKCKTNKDDVRPGNIIRKTWTRSNSKTLL